MGNRPGTAWPTAMSSLEPIPARLACGAGSRPAPFSQDSYDNDDVDPRRIRSRTRLLDAAEDLLSTGGIEAVTIDAVTKASKVARTTLYRHFGSSSDLLAATFERLLPKGAMIRTSAIIPAAFLSIITA